MAPDRHRPDPVTLRSLLAPACSSGAGPLLRTNHRVLQPLHDERSVPLANFDFDRRTCRQLQYRRSLTCAQMS